MRLSWSLPTEPAFRGFCRPTQLLKPCTSGTPPTVCGMAAWASLLSSCPASSCNDAWVQGSLKVVLEGAADVQLRDWLLDGVRLSVLRTARQLPAAVAPGTTAGLEAGPAAQPSAVRQTVVADASFVAGALVDGVTRDLQACVKLMSCMPLFTASGRRIGWQEAHERSEQVTYPGGPASAY